MTPLTQLGAYKGPFSRPSLFSLRLDLSVRGFRKGSATGFFYLPRSSGPLYLVTNYHVLKARDPQKPDDPLPGWPERPDEVSYRLLSRPDLKIVSSSVKLEHARFLEHPRRSDGVDLIAMEVDPPKNGLILTQDHLDLVSDIELAVGGDLFIVGFPFGFGAGDFLPIWKRGTIASEPNYQPFGLGMFYIDASTKPGMSGSPVFAAESREFLKVDAEVSRAFAEWERGEREPMDVIELMQDKKQGDVVMRRQLRLVGVYSGRLTVSGGDDSQIGIVWTKELLDEVFQAL